MQLNSSWFRAIWEGSDHSLAESVHKEEQILLEEIRQAHKNWLTAQAQFDFALGQDQIDYAICCLEATEKRYEMLLREVKKLHVNRHDRGTLPGVKLWSSSM